MNISRKGGTSNETMGSVSCELRNCSGVLGSSYFVGVSGYVEYGRSCGGGDGASGGCNNYRHLGRSPTMSITVSEKCNKCGQYWANVQCDREDYDKNGFICPTCKDLVEVVNVYCGQCKWYWREDGAISCEGCAHVANIRWVETYVKRVKGPAWVPATKNASNDCPLYDPINKGPEVIETLDRPRGHGLKETPNR